MSGFVSGPDVATIRLPGSDRATDMHTGGWLWEGHLAQGSNYGDKVRGWRGRPGGGRGKSGSRGRETYPWEPDCRIGFIQLRFLHKLKIEPLYCMRLRMCVCLCISVCQHACVCVCVCVYVCACCSVSLCYVNILWMCLHACVCVCVWLFMDSLGASLRGQ